MKNNIYINIEEKYDEFGYDKKGYNKSGYNKEGYTKNGYNRAGFNKEGYDKNGYNKSGHNNQGKTRKESLKMIEKEKKIINIKKNIEKGWVYILISPSSSSLIKIGYTYNLPEKRAKEISKVTGVPYPYIVIYKKLFFNCKEVEKKIHNYFSNYRVNKSREFFEIRPYDAMNYLETLDM